MKSSDIEKLKNIADGGGARHLADALIGLRWLFEAKKRYRLDILNYTVTSNHTLCEVSHKVWFWSTA